MPEYTGVTATQCGALTTGRGAVVFATDIDNGIAQVK